MCIFIQNQKWFNPIASFYRRAFVCKTRSDSIFTFLSVDVHLCGRKWTFVRPMHIAFVFTQKCMLFLWAASSGSHTHTHTCPHAHMHVHSHTHRDGYLHVSFAEFPWEVDCVPGWRKEVHERPPPHSRTLPVLSPDGIGTEVKARLLSGPKGLWVAVRWTRECGDRRVRGGGRALKCRPRNCFTKERPDPGEEPAPSALSLRPCNVLFLQLVFSVWISTYSSSSTLCFLAISMSVFFGFRLFDRLAVFISS